MLSMLTVQLIVHRVVSVFRDHPLKPPVMHFTITQPHKELMLDHVNHVLPVTYVPMQGKVLLLPLTNVQRVNGVLRESLQLSNVQQVPIMRYLDQVQIFQNVSNALSTITVLRLQLTNMPTHAQMVQTVLLEVDHPSSVMLDNFVIEQAILLYREPVLQDTTAHKVLLLKLHVLASPPLSAPLLLSLKEEPPQPVQLDSISQEVFVNYVQKVLCVRQIVM